MFTTSTGRRTDAGSGPVTAILGMGMLALVLAIGLTGLSAVAGDEGATAQHAADAAALAGAQRALDEVPSSLRGGFTRPDDIAGLLGGGTCLQTGVVEASQLATSNEATVTHYCYNAFSDRVSVSVELNSTQVAGPPATAKAQAASTFDAGQCQLDSDFVAPTPPPSPDPGQTDPPPTAAAPAPRPDPIATSINCGFGDVPVTFYPAALRFRFADLATAMADQRPRLTG